MHHACPAGSLAARANPPCIRLHHRNRRRVLRVGTIEAAALTRRVQSSVFAELVPTGRGAARGGGDGSLSASDEEELQRVRCVKGGEGSASASSRHRRDLCGKVGGAGKYICQTPPFVYLGAHPDVEVGSSAGGEAESGPQNSLLSHNRHVSLGGAARGWRRGEWATADKPACLTSYNRKNQLLIHFSTFRRFLPRIFLGRLYQVQFDYPLTPPNTAFPRLSTNQSSLSLTNRQTTKPEHHHQPALSSHLAAGSATDSLILSRAPPRASTMGLNPLNRNETEEQKARKDKCIREGQVAIFKGLAIGFAFSAPLVGGGTMTTPLHRFPSRRNLNYNKLEASPLATTDLLHQTPPRAPPRHEVSARHREPGGGGGGHDVGAPRPHHSLEILLLETLSTTSWDWERALPRTRTSTTKQAPRPPPRQEVSARYHGAR